MTTNICKNLLGGHSVPPAQVAPGDHFLALSGNFDGATVEIWANVGVDARIATFLQPAGAPVRLPRCTLYALVTSAGAETSIDIAIAPLSQRVHPADSYTRLKLVGVVA